MLKQLRPDLVIVAAAKVGGILANSTFGADFIFENLQIQTNIIGAAFEADVEKLLFLGSSCIYPKHCKQPMVESDLLSGALEKTNEPYAIAKIAGIKLCSAFNTQYGTDYRVVLPTNLYGYGDYYHVSNSHVIPGMIARMHRAKYLNSESIDVWGTGNVQREFMFVDDLVSACLAILNVERDVFQRGDEETCQIWNVGTGFEVCINALAEMIKATVNFQGRICFDSAKPEGTPRKRLDNSKLQSIGWQPHVELGTGLKYAYEDFLEALERGRLRQ